jgi:group I intron endonuclease
VTVGIYLLVFEGTDAVYVGQSNNIEKRYKEHNYTLRKGQGSSKLQAAYNTYGVPMLEILSICEADALDFKEVFYIKEFNAIDNGFNTALGGGSGSTNLKGEIHPLSLYSDEDCLHIMEYIISNSGKTNNEIAKELGYSIALISAISGGYRRPDILKEKYPVEFNKLTEVRIHRDSLRDNPRQEVIQNKEAYIKVATLLATTDMYHKSISEVTGIGVGIVSGISSCKRHKWLANVIPSIWHTLLTKTLTKNQKT